MTSVELPCLAVYLGEGSWVERGVGVGVGVGVNTMTTAAA